MKMSTKHSNSLFFVSPHSGLVSYQRTTPTQLVIFFFLLGVDLSGIPREQIFVTTKLYEDDQGFEKALEACELSLEKLGLDYIGKFR
jgi:hypothetical protein